MSLLHKEFLMDKNNKSITKVDKQLDCIGLFCPEPVYQTRMEVDKLTKGQILEVFADDPAAEGDIVSLAKRLNLQIFDIKKEGNIVRILIKK